MITAKEINSIIGITESFMLPEKLLSLLLSEKKNKIFGEFLKLQNDLSFDWFTDYFQEEHSNRNAMMQDFTPKELTELLPQLTGGFSKVLDICAGTGGLSIGAWQRNPDALFVCEELSERALPLLLFNMAIRNIRGFVINKNVLSGEVMAVYRLQKGESYSEIKRIDDEPQIDGFDLIITNPPYSLKYDWKQLPPYLAEFGAPPTKAADYAFVLYGLSRMVEDGRLCAILPHGVLFRGQKEGDIRQCLIKKKRLEGVIGLPDKLFLNTQIPVCILVLSNRNEGAFFIDASREYLKESKQNRLRPEDVNKIADTFVRKATVGKYSRMVAMSELEENDNNCNIPRYVDTFEKKPLPDMNQLTEELIRIDRDIRKTELELAKSLEELVGSDEDEKIIRKYIRHLKRENERYEQLTIDLQAVN